MADSVNWRWAQYLLAISAAVFPLLGVFYWGWSVREVILIYWAENVVIGFWQLVKMLGSGGAGILGGDRMTGGERSSLGSTLFMMAFFTLHYGGFCGAHGVFVLSLTGDEQLDDLMNPDWWWGPFIFVGFLVGVIEMVWSLLPEESLWSIASLFAMRGLGVWQDYFATGQWRRAKAKELMGEPYRNVVVLHVAIIVSGFLVMAFEGAWPLLVLIVLGKLVIDIIGLRKVEKKGKGNFANPASA